MAKLLSCPFCGGRPNIKSVETGYYSNGDNAFIVRCTRCRIGTTPIIFGDTYTFYRGIKNKTFTQKEAEREVINIWNSREENIKAEYEGAI